MLIINGKDDLIKVPNSNTEVTWKCGHCGEVRTEPSRNLRRRIWFCQCVKKQDQIKDFERRLNEKGFTFRHDLTDEYKLNHNGMIDQSKTTIPIECLRCGSRFNSRLSNVLSGRKKCDCAPNKHHTTDLTAQEYIQKWTKHNQKHFDLLDMEYKGALANTRFGAGLVVLLTLAGNYSAGDRYSLQEVRVKQHWGAQNR